MKISDLAREYAKKYINFLIENDIYLSSRDAYNMFRFTLCRLYGFNCGEYSPLLLVYHNDCYNTLLDVKERYTVSGLIEKKSIIEFSCVYTLVLIQYCSGNIRVRDAGLDLLSC